ncbi:class I adenylate-forming enzyme family protein [Micromonospora sp. NBC_01796]|uniref:class I adenylate-forming enzyme family protein n=1 Tax=Micromonospora sp. NBC_01796 TaxID=2975987 RepID=UPI002DD7B90A|nr:AMP-binding protein [Micromonospora sp. NBC_01796]WSA84592.1 AMP-binding protein [Micromonospora sp. NBC_01796]
MTNDGASAGRTVPEVLSWRAAVHPDRVAIEVHQVATLTFAEWDAGASAVATALRQRGLGAGDRVGLLFGAPDWVDFAVAYCGVQRAGGVAVPLSDRLAATQVRQALEHCAATTLIHGPGTTPAAAPVRVATVAELVAAGTAAPQPHPGPVVRPGDLAQILYTSGTTGRPKGVGATHANLTVAAPSHPRRLALAHSERFLHAFAIGTNAAQTMLFNALTAKPTALTLPQFTPARFARLIGSPGTGTVFVVPSMAIELLNSGALGGRDTSGVQLIGSTAAPLAPAVAARLATAFPNAVIVNYYTSTEAAPAQTTMIFNPARPDAVGRAAAGALMIADEQGRPLPEGATGQVWLRCRHPRAYYRDEQASRATFHGEWVRMGDVGRMDAEGYLYLADRHEDVVKSGAFKISTLEIEAALYEHTGIAETAVVGIPHPVLGSTVAAVVVPHPQTPAADLSLPALRAFLTTRLADYQLPTRLLVLDQLPRNEAGKVLKRQLVGQLEQTRTTPHRHPSEGP